MARSMTALLLASHPGPSVVVTVVATVLGASLGYPPGRLALLALAILLGQLSIGWSNDWLDAARDAQVERTDKPAARGAIRVTTVRTWAFVALVAAILVTLLLGPLATLAHAIAIAGGWAYNLGLKATAISFRSRSASGSCPPSPRSASNRRASPPPGSSRRVPCSASPPTSPMCFPTSRTTTAQASGDCRTGWGRCRAGCSRSPVWPRRAS